MLNLHICGRLGADPETRTAGSGTVTTFNVATTSARKGDDGKYATEWIRVSAWNKMGELLQKYFHKGDIFDGYGDLTVERYTTREGTPGFQLNLQLRNYSFATLSGKHEENAAPVASTPSPAPVTAPNNNDLPF